MRRGEKCAGMRRIVLHHHRHARQTKLLIGVDGIASRRTPMTNFVGDNDHGDTFPPSEVLFKEVLELRKQRDEARRELCMVMGGKGGRSSHISPDAIDYAKSRGWDCFRDYDKANEALDKLSKLDQELGLS